MPWWIWVIVGWVVVSVSLGLLVARIIKFGKDDLDDGEM